MALFAFWHGWHVSKDKLQGLRKLKVGMFTDSVTKVCI